MIVVAVIAIASIGGAEAAGFATGKAAVLTGIWFVIKQRSPSWVAGWSGAWLFIAGVVAVLVPPAESKCVSWSMPPDSGPLECVERETYGPNPVTAGLVVSTVLTLPSMAVWKVGRLIRRLAGRDEGGVE